MTNTPSDGIDARLAAYRRSARRYGRLRERVEGVITRIAQVRMVAFLVAAVCFFVGWWDGQPIYLVPGGIGLVVYKGSSISFVISCCFFVLFKVLITCRQRARACSSFSA